MTSIEWLEEKIFIIGVDFLSEEFEFIKQAKEMHKQEIIDAHINGHNAPSSTIKNFDAEQYYQETFGSGLSEKPTTQTERMYSEKEVIKFLDKREDYVNETSSIIDYQTAKEWFEKFKKK